MARLREQIDGVLSGEPGSPMLAFEGRWHSRAQLADGRRERVELLEQAGLGSETRVAVVLRNRPEFVAAMLELIASERCLVTLNSIFADGRLAGDIDAVAARALIANPRDWQRPGFEAAVRK